MLIILRISSHFNSIKVQLEQNAVDETQFSSLFQFHKGTIRTNKNLDELMI